MENELSANAAYDCRRCARVWQRVDPISLNPYPDVQHGGDGR